MSFLFAECTFSELLQDLFKTELLNTNFYELTDRCSSFESFRYINTNTNKNHFMTNSLKELPDISKWNLSNVKDISWLFLGCS